jgi:hypothetical protein
VAVAEIAVFLFQIGNGGFTVRSMLIQGIYAQLAAAISRAAPQLGINICL